MFKKVVLKNGLTVLMETIPYLRSATVGIWVLSGSVYENEKTNGISHFLEHLMFKGTESRSAQDIAEELDMLGGHLNAFSSKEYTCYYAKVMDQHLNSAIELLSDLVLHSRFDQEDIDKERQVIEEEIRMYEDTPEELVHEVFVQNLFSSHPLGRPILGTSDVIAGINRNEICDFYGEYYVPENIILSIAGSFNEDEIIKQIEELFVFEKKPLKKLPKIKKAKMTFKESLIKKPIEQVHIVTGTRGIDQKSSMRYPLTVLSIALGGGMSSRLFQEIREKRGLAYSVYSYQSSYKSGGVFATYVGCSAQRVSDVMEVISSQVKLLKDKGFTEKELLRAKEQLKGNFLLGLESTNNIMNRMARNEIYYGKYVSIEEIISNIEKITNKDIQKIAEYLFSEKQSIAAIGDIDTLDT